MTIKQQGGVFGRNPTFNDADISNDLSVGNDATVAGDLTVGGSGLIDNLKVVEDFELRMNPTAFGSVAGYGYIFKTGSGGSAPFNQAGALVYQPRTSTTDGRSNHKFYTGDPLTLALDLKPDQTAHFGNNIVLPSGNGIDFSATSGTGTSELFDDYEEGTFTPIYEASSSNPTVTYDIQAGHYTKIGNVCHCIIRIRTDAVSGGSGNLRLAGLPFAAKSAASSAMSGGITVNRADSFTTNTPANGLITGGAQYIEFYTDAAWGTQVTTSNLTNSANSNQLILSVVYQTA